jgi:hypothetical protein
LVGFALAVTLAGCAILDPAPSQIPPVYTWTQCFPAENDIALRFGIRVDYCEDPAWDGRHWGVVAYYAGTPREDYLGLAWNIWYSPGRAPNLAQLRVVLRLDNGERFVGASGARPRFECRRTAADDCGAVVVTLRGSEGRVAERVVEPRAGG